MRASVVGLGIVVALLSMQCGVNSGNVTGVASNQIDTIAEAFHVFIQWANTNNVKTEFDMIVDNNPPIHFELQAFQSLAILIGDNLPQDRDPIPLDADNVVVVRVNTPCPDQIIFENILFGDQFFTGDIVFAQTTVASETEFGPDEDGFLQPVTFFCFSAWQVIVNESDIIVTALDRQPVGVDESETDIDTLLADLLSSDQQNDTPVEEENPSSEDVNSLFDLLSGLEGTTSEEGLSGPGRETPADEQPADGGPAVIEGSPSIPDFDSGSGLRPPGS